MEKLTPSVLTKATLKRFIHLEEQDGNDYEWLQVDSIFLTVDEQHDLQQVQARLRNTRIHLMNEATLWARAYLNWQNDAQEPQEIFGCYTIAGSWSFMRAEVSGITLEKPTLKIESSGEYSEPTEATTIVKILKKIVAKNIT